jgi:3-methyladenine DNA glycosylase AlkD
VATLGAGDGSPGELAASLLDRLRGLADPDNVAGMARYGISAVGTLGVPMSTLRQYERELRPLRRNRPADAHALAAELWASGVHEARILAGLVDAPSLVTPEQADAWVAELDSWDTCDQLQHLFAATPFAYDLVERWSGAEHEVTKRAGFVLLATLAVHDKTAPDDRLVALLPLVVREAGDGRNLVKKGVNWALRQVGKRSPSCHRAAVAAAEEILARQAGSAAARWVAKDALRELRSDAAAARLARAGAHA